MPTPNLPSPAPTGARPTAVDHERERVVQALATHYAYDRLSLEAFEERLERAYAAASSAQLMTLLADLPAATPDELSAAGVPRAVAAQSLANAAPRAPEASVPARGFAAALMGGVERRGAWVVPRHLKVYAVMGGAKIDLREARFGAGVTEIDVVAIMGGVELLVPPHVRVECSGAAIMGGFEADTDVGQPAPDGPVLRVSGMAFWGGVEAQTRLPGESARDYRRRRREERRRLGRG